MSKGRKGTSSGTLLELWRPPQAAGQPVGCLASTYTFAASVFEEDCLSRFLALDSDPDREGVAFLLERENALGGCFAGVLVDHRYAGVPHSLRWDVLRVNIPRGKQHAKLSVLAWSRHVRIIVASANLTDAGYRSNQEVAVAVDLTPDDADLELWTSCREYLDALLGFVTDPGSTTRARRFLTDVAGLVDAWRPGRPGGGTRRRLVCTLPAPGQTGGARSALAEALEGCRRYGGHAPSTVDIVSPFFDQAQGDSAAVRVLCRGLGRGVSRRLSLHVPAGRDANGVVTVVKAPRELRTVAEEYVGDVTVHALPARDSDANPRDWHAKMFRFSDEGYVALMIGSSNFTAQGLGTGPVRNAEANLLMVAETDRARRQATELKAVWPESELLDDDGDYRWEGSADDGEAEAGAPPLPDGFLGATLSIGQPSQLILHLNPEQLPDTWSVWSCLQPPRELCARTAAEPRWTERTALVKWSDPQVPTYVEVRWGESARAFLAVNVEDATELPPPVELSSLTADQMLRLLAATNPAAAVRSLLAGAGSDSAYDEGLDSLASPDLDPLRRHRLSETFLQRVRARAREMARMREHLSRPVWSRHALEWRLNGMIGPRAYAQRLVVEIGTGIDASQAILTIADLLIVLAEVSYEEAPGALDSAQFRRIYRSFLRSLQAEVEAGIEPVLAEAAPEIRAFWTSVKERCA